RRVDLLEPRARLDAELIDERAARLVVALERVRLTAGAVEREHQLAPQPLPERELIDERLEFADEVAGAAQLAACVDAVLDGVGAELLQPPDLVLRERLEREVCEGRSAPERQRLAEEAGPLFCASLARRRAQLLEPRQVEAVGLDLQHVPGRLR